MYMAESNGLWQWRSRLPARAAKMLIIHEILARQQLGEQDDLAGMHREMLDHMGDRLQNRDVVTLGSNSFNEPGGRQGTDEGGSFDNAQPKQIGQLFGRFATSRVELGVPLPMIGQSGHARTNPLPDVARKM